MSLEQCIWVPANPNIIVRAFKFRSKIDLDYLTTKFFPPSKVQIQIQKFHYVTKKQKGRMTPSNRKNRLDLSLSFFQIKIILKGTLRIDKIYGLNSIKERSYLQLWNHLLRRI